MKSGAERERKKWGVWGAGTARPQCAPDSPGLASAKWPPARCHSATRALLFLGFNKTKEEGGRPAG